MTDLALLAAIAIFLAAALAIIRIAKAREDDLNATINAARRTSIRDAALISRLRDAQGSLLSRNHELERALARINQTEKDRLDGLPRSFFMGVDYFGPARVARTTALTHTEVRHQPTGITLSDNGGSLRITTADGRVYTQLNDSSIAEAA